MCLCVLFVERPSMGKRAQACTADVGRDRATLLYRHMYARCNTWREHSICPNCKEGETPSPPTHPSIPAC